MSSRKVQGPGRKPAVSAPDEVFERAAEVFRVMADPMRLKIVRCLCQGDKSVPHLAAEIRATGQDVRRHLELLHEAGLVGARSEGGEVCYGLLNEQVRLLLRGCLQAGPR